VDTSTSKALHKPRHQEFQCWGHRNVATKRVNSGKRLRQGLPGYDQAPPEIRQPANAVNFWSVAAATLALFYFVTSVYIASHRLFWYDELFTIRVARLPNWLTIWTALSQAVDALPPIYYLVVRMSGDPFGNSEVAARLPSALALAFGLLLTFDCARRLSDGLHGLIALSVLTCSFLPYYGYEARSYAIYFMLAALALWVWTCTRAVEKWSAVLFGAVLGLSVTMHYYAVLCLVPYAVWELARWRPWQPPSPKLTAGLLGVVLSTALTSKLMLSSSHQFSAGFWAPPSFYALSTGFSTLFPDGLFLLALVMIWIGLTKRAASKTVVEEMQPAESLGWFFLCIPLVGFVVAELKTNAFVMRYFIGALPGVAVAFSCLLWRHFHNIYRVSTGVLVLLAACGAANQWTIVRHPESIAPYGLEFATRQYLRLEDALRSDGKPFALFPDSRLYLEAAYYAKSEDCIFLLGSDATQKANELNLLRLAQYYPLQFWTMDDLKRHASQTAFIAPRPDTLDTLRLAGFQISVRFTKPLSVVYLQR